MSLWSDVYFLKSNAGVHDIWDCLRNVFPDFREHSFSESVPCKFSFENENKIFIWNCPQDENELIEFRFLKKFYDNESALQRQKKSLRLAFDRKLYRHKAGDVHALFYEETAENSDLMFCTHLFPMIKKIVPKGYFSAKVLDDRQIAKELYLHGSLSSVELSNMIKEQVEKSGKMWLCNTIKFSADENGKFFFPSEWIEKLSDELWFLNANFIKSYGMLSAINAENYKKKADIKKFEKQSKERGMEERFERTFKVDKDVEKERRLVSEDVDIRSKIIINSYSSWEKEILSDDVEFDFDENGYEILKNKIISSFCPNVRSSEVNEKIRESIPNLLEKDKTAEKIFDEKVEFQLKESGLDRGSLEEILKVNRSLKSENDSLKKEIEFLKSKNSSIDKKAVDYKKSAENIETKFTESPSAKKDMHSKTEDFLLKENEALQNEIKMLQNENSSLKSRIVVLENKKESQQNNREGYSLAIPCSCKELFDGEITDYLQLCLYSKIEEDEKNLPKNEETEVSRKKDVVKALLEERKYHVSESATKNKIDRIEKILKSNDRPSLEELKHEGFIKIDKTKTHPKTYFYDERYQVTFSSTPSDNKRGDLNKMAEIKRRCFLL